MLRNIQFFLTKSSRQFMKGSPGEDEVNVSFGVHKCVSGGVNQLIKRENTGIDRSTSKIRRSNPRGLICIN